MIHKGRSRMPNRRLLTQDMTNDEWAAAQAEWRDPGNWHFGFYYAPHDPHVCVRKQRVEFGWTLNMARRASGIWIVAILATPLWIAVLLRVLG